MSRSNAEIWRWQKELEAQPRVWWVRSRPECEEPDSFYESREGARLELEFRKNKLGERGLCIVSSPIHSDKLSSERWES